MKSPVTAFDPLEFCDICFQKARPNLCETYKNTFTKITSIHFSQQNKLDRLLNRLESTPRMADRRWTCSLAGSARGEFLDSLWGIGVSVHTLDDHLKVLTRLYKPDVRALGPVEEIEIPSTDPWEEFDPKTRSWNSVKIVSKGSIHVAKARLGNVLRSSTIDGAVYYRANRQDDSASLVPMERRAAYNIICTIAEPITARWKADATGQNAFLDSSELGPVPDEIFSFLRRMGKKERGSDVFAFETEDLDSVRAALSCIKISLEKSSETVDSGKADKSGTPISIASIEKERLGALTGIIAEMGGTVEDRDGHLVVSGKRGSTRITFTHEEKSSQDGSDLRVSIYALEEPPRLSEILSTIKKKVGLLDTSLENSIARHWPIVNESDLQYVVQSAISWYGSNPVLACSIISGGGKLGKIKEWNTKIKEGKARSSLDTITLGKIIRRLES